MKRNRAYYRHQRERYIAHVEYIIKYSWRWIDRKYNAFPSEDFEEDVKIISRKMQKHRPLCSCEDCSPTRKYEGMTPQERRQAQLYQDPE